MSLIGVLSGNVWKDSDEAVKTQLVTKPTIALALEYFYLNLFGYKPVSSFINNFISTSLSLDHKMYTEYMNSITES